MQRPARCRFRDGPFHFFSRLFPATIGSLKPRLPERENASVGRVHCSFANERMVSLRIATPFRTHSKTIATSRNSSRSIEHRSAVLSCGSRHSGVKSQSWAVPIRPAFVLQSWSEAISACGWTFAALLGSLMPSVRNGRTTGRQWRSGSAFIILAEFTSPALHSRDGSWNLRSHLDCARTAGGCVIHRKRLFSDCHHSIGPEQSGPFSYEMADISPCSARGI
jgi:hypothetical protein